MDFGSERGVDRISDLPDHILCHILSFLPTKFAVASSILATRWRYLWASIPIVDIDTRQHREIYPIFNINMSRRSDITFQNFVSRILLLNGTSHIQKFRLIYDCRHNPGTIQTWFDVAITHNIQELELDLFSSVRGELVKLPRKLFTSNSLVVLKLSRMPLGVPSLVCLPRLKILELRRITYSDDKCIQNLLSGCPVLQDLVVEETAREKPRVQGLLRDRDEVRKTPPQPVPECLGNQLKHFLIEEFYAGFKPDAVEYLVQHVNILKKLIMYCQCPIMLRTQIDCTL
ncbi:hypothetical protein Cgig2_013272 [Carnegiea gigantea]|uniref:F-box domain-containing protein n=1 Tax=Carnegiea gigantea TaxID=171969 RepID=A0A9Q1K3T4_9CARY|nr:hypothetical protein Cgig2_013272 [Carnegiea gigantea]